MNANLNNLWSMFSDGFTLAEDIGKISKWVHSFQKTEKKSFTIYSLFSMLYIYNYTLQTLVKMGEKLLKFCTFL